jgi:hypothetical protein
LGGLLATKLASLIDLRLRDVEVGTIVGRTFDRDASVESVGRNGRNNEGMDRSGPSGPPYTLSHFM